MERRVELKTCKTYEVISGIMYMEKEMTIVIERAKWKGKIGWKGK